MTFLSLGVDFAVQLNIKINKINVINNFKYFNLLENYYKIINY